MNKLTIPISGMHCASCASVIEKTLRKVPGVKSCDVNYGNEKAKLEYDESKVNLDELNSKIKPFGYSFANVENSAKHDMHNHNNEAQSKSQKIKELSELRSLVEFSLPITLFVFFTMMWEILAKTVDWFPKFFIPMELYNPIVFVLATIILFWIGQPYLKGVWLFLKHRVASMDTLVGIGTLTAYLYSSLHLLFPQVAQILKLPATSYFDVTIVVIGFIVLGKFLEMRSKLKTGEAIEKLINLQAKTALLDINGVNDIRISELKKLGYVISENEVEVKIEDVKIGDTIKIKPGGKIPVDGVITEGRSSIDESMITGEPIPVDKAVGDNVISGTINKQGMILLRADKVGSETLLAHIIKMVEEAQGSRAPIQKLADKISSIFVPMVIVISMLTLLIWLVVGSSFLPFDEAFALGLTCFIGVLVIACPCAMGLATPTAIIVGTGKGAENGILIKNAESLEKLHKVNVIVTDKTGTITKGEPEVTDIVIQSTKYKDQNEVIKILASLEKHSEHPLAVAIMKKTKSENITLENSTDFAIIEGKGLKGTLSDSGKMFYAGNIKLMNELNIEFDKSVVEEMTQQGKTPVFLTSENELIAIIGIADTVKENAKETIAALHKLGLKIILLTGDHANTAKYIADQVGIDAVVAEVLPQEKADVIKYLQGKIHVEELENKITPKISNFKFSISNSSVAMLGDGVNDAPALAQADVGIAMGTGTDVAIEAAEITILKGDISKVLKAIHLSKATMRTIKQNLFWAFIYNIIGIPVAAGLLYPIWGILLNPIFAGLAMGLSSVSVVTNSLKLKLARN